MLKQIKLENFGPLSEMEWPHLAPINLIIGSNACGKTFLLKAMYCAIRTVEASKRGQELRSINEILVDKLYWTFQPERIGELVRKGADRPLRFDMRIDGAKFGFGFGRDTTRSIISLENDVPPRSSNSVFLPPKEVLSLQNVVLRSREIDQAFGFDDTYYDLAKALTLRTQMGKNFKAFAESRQRLEALFDGRIEFDLHGDRWVFRTRQGQKFQIGVTSEGIKKIGILDTLLGNRYLSPDSVVFIDEPESALHPKAIAEFLDIIDMLSRLGLQFFIATHSYFVIKKLALLATQSKSSLPVLSFVDQAWQRHDLKDGMPPNPIIDESIRLYESELGGLLA